MTLLETLRKFEKVYSQCKGMPWIGTVTPQEAFKLAADEIEALAHITPAMFEAGNAAQHPDDCTDVRAIYASMRNAALVQSMVARPEWTGGDCPTCSSKHPFDNVFCSDGYHHGEAR